MTVHGAGRLRSYRNRWCTSRPAAQTIRCKFYILYTIYCVYVWISLCIWMYVYMCLTSPQALRRGFISCDQALQNEGKSRKSGACALALVIVGSQMHVAHVGDCRVSPNFCAHLRTRAISHLYLYINCFMNVCWRLHVCFLSLLFSLSVSVHNMYVCVCCRHHRMCSLSCSFVGLLNKIYIKEGTEGGAVFRKLENILAL